MTNIGSTLRAAQRRALTQINALDAIRLESMLQESTGPECYAAQEPMMHAQPHLQELTPTEVHDAMRATTSCWSMCASPTSTSTERIHGALLFPLSSFDPRALPVGGRRGAALRFRQALRHGGGEMPSRPACRSPRT